MTTIRSMLAALAAGLLLTSCLGSSGNQTFDDGFYRFVHVSPGGDTVAVSADGKTIVPSLKYHAASNYVQLAWGTPQITVQPAAGGAPYSDSRVPVAGGAHYTYILYGGGASTITLSFRDDVGDASSGFFLLRDIHLATGIAPVDIYLLAPGTALAGATPAFTSLAYGGSTSFTQYGVGDYNIVITPTGTKDVIYDSGRQAFPQNTKATLLIYSAGSGTLVNAALLLNDSNGTTNYVDNPAARYKFVDATTELPLLDFLIDGSVALAGVTYGAISPYLPVAAGSRNLKIQPTTSPGAYLYDQNQSLGGGADYSLVAYSNPGAGSAGMIVLNDNNLPPPSGKAMLRIVNASSDATAYDVYANTTRLAAGVAQGASAGYQAVDPGTYTLAIDPAGTTDTAASTTATIAADHVYTLYAYGRSGAAVAAVTQDD